MYGLTECKRVCYLEPELLDKKPGSVGKAIPGTEVFILDQEGNPVSTGETGILHIRGPHIMAGYWNNEEQSREMLKQGKYPVKRYCAHMTCLRRMRRDFSISWEGRMISSRPGVKK